MAGVTFPTGYGIILCAPCAVGFSVAPGASLLPPVAALSGAV